MDQLTILVTGAGALVGQGILRSLRMSARPMRIVTADPEPRAAGHWLGDCAYTIPMADAADFVARVEEIVRGERVDVLFVGTDVELAVLSRERVRLEAAHGVRVVVSSPRVIEIADDKWLTARFFEQEGLPFPRSALATDRAGIERLVGDVGFPLFVKPRRGARSVGAGVARDADALEALCARRPDLLAQELLPDHPGEYTAGCLVTGGRCASVVVLRRDLRDGNTYRAYSELDHRFDDFVADAAERLGADGPCNFQFRVRAGAPVVFEINARFSGTTPIRAVLGVNEVDALLAHLVAGTPIPAARPRPGVVLRVWSDVLVAPEELAALGAVGRLPDPRCEEVPFGRDGAPAA